MSKYFTDDNDLSSLTTQIEQPTTSVATPIPNPVDNSIQNQINSQNEIPKKPTNVPTSVEEHIASVTAQNNEVNTAMKHITQAAGEQIENDFKSLAPLELFERMNQLTYLIVKMNNKLTAIEKLLIDGGDAKTELDAANIRTESATHNTSTTTSVSPKEQYLKQQEDSKRLSAVELAQQQLSKGMYNHGNGLPSEGYADESNNLEKIFPNMPEEAYQAAYESQVTGK